MIEEYFATARERYNIKLRRENGDSRPWTTDKIFQNWRFCNVHREDDKTTRWFSHHVRDPLSIEGDPVKIAKATVIFRWFNRIETGAIIHDMLMNGNWNSEIAKDRLRDTSPIVTGAYIIKGPDGFSKLGGVCYCVDIALPKLEQQASLWGNSLQGAWKDLKEYYYLGPFMAYEIVSDLRWTPILQNAEDINTWANAGPGCARGLGWTHHNNPMRYNRLALRDQQEMNVIMQELLEMSRSDIYWPQDWKPWEMREVEHWACEFDKICRARRGESLKRRYNGS